MRQPSTLWTWWPSTGLYAPVAFTRTNWGARRLKRRIQKRRAERDLPERDLIPLERCDDPNT